MLKVLIKAEKLERFPFQFLPPSKALTTGSFWSQTGPCFIFLSHSSPPSLRLLPSAPFSSDFSHSRRRALALPSFHLSGGMRGRRSVGTAACRREPRPAVNQSAADAPAGVLYRRPGLLPCWIPADVFFGTVRFGLPPQGESIFIHIFLREEASAVQRAEPSGFLGAFSFPGFLITQPGIGCMHVSFEWNKSFHVCTKCWVTLAPVSCLKVGIRRGGNSGSKLLPNLLDLLISVVFSARR